MSRFCVIVAVLFLLRMIFLTGPVRAAHGPTAAPPTAGASSQKSDAAKDDDADNGDDDDDDDSATTATGQGSHAQAEDQASRDDDQDDDDQNDADDDNADDNGNEIIGNVNLTTDYMLRGLTQTENQPAVQGGFDWQPEHGLFAGIWGSNVRFEDRGSTMELDAYVGYNLEVSPIWDVSLQALFYSYLSGTDANGWVFPLTATWMKKIAIEVDFLPQWEALSGVQAWYFNAAWHQKLVWDLTFGAAAGYSVFTAGSDFPNYPDGKLSVSRQFLGLTWELDGIFASQLNVPELDGVQGGARAVFSLSKEL